MSLSDIAHVTKWAKVTKDHNQLDHFKEAARRLKSKDDETAFKEKLGKLVTQKPDGENGEANQG